jgi:hypothetical protein
MWDWLSHLPLYIQVFLGSAVGTTFVGFAFRVAEIIVQNRIDRSNAQYKDRKELAEQVIALCIEAKSSVYTLAPKSIETTYTTAEKVRLEDEKAGDLIDQLIALWQVCAGFDSKKAKLSNEEAEFVMYLQKEAKHTSDKLLRIINKWRK